MQMMTSNKSAVFLETKLDFRKTAILPVQINEDNCTLRNDINYSSELGSGIMLTPGQTRPIGESETK